MTEFAPRSSLLRVTAATRKELDHWDEGVYLERSTGRSLSQLRARATVDRLSLAADCRRRARRLERLELYRDAISRSYYAIYHAFRAVVFFATPGDDSQEHRALPGAIPSDFPNVETWRNDLKQARLTRNNADYAPYPKAESAWRADCADVARLADSVLREARSYLQTKGCTGA